MYCVAREGKQKERFGDPKKLIDIMFNCLRGSSYSSLESEITIRKADTPEGKALLDKAEKELGEDYASIFYETSDFESLRRGDHAFSVNIDEFTDGKALRKYAENGNTYIGMAFVEIGGM